MRQANTFFVDDRYPGFGSFRDYRRRVAAETSAFTRCLRCFLRGAEDEPQLEVELPPQPDPLALALTLTLSLLRNLTVTRSSCDGSDSLPTRWRTT